MTKEEFLNYARHSEFFKTQMDKTDSDSMAHKQEAIAKAERAFKLFDKDNDGYLSCFQNKFHRERIKKWQGIEQCESEAYMET